MTERVIPEAAVEGLWVALMDGEPPVDESVEITSADINQQTAGRWSK